MRDFKKIIAWQKAHALSVAMHRVADQSRLRVSPGLHSQLLKAVAAIPAQISEGSGARTDAEFARFLDMALKTSREVENHLLHARDLGAIAVERSDALVADLDEVRRVLFCFARSVRKRAGLDDAGDRW
jgi:four helix bundle protein